MDRSPESPPRCLAAVCVVMKERKTGHCWRSRKQAEKPYLLERLISMSKKGQDLIKIYEQNVAVKYKTRHHIPLIIFTN